MPGSVIGWLFIGVWVVAFVALIVRALKSRLTPVKKEKAVVTDKCKTESFSRYRGNGKAERYVIVFDVGGKNRSFYVSEFSYGGYRVGEKGTLTYKGDRLIDFS